MALIGDAARPFLPHLAQGGAQAIEDSVALATMLPYGVEKSAVPLRLGLYNEARYNRASKIQAWTRLAGDDNVKDAQASKADFSGNVSTCKNMGPYIRTDEKQFSISWSRLSATTSFIILPTSCANMSGGRRMISTGHSPSLLVQYPAFHHHHQSQLNRDKLPVAQRGFAEQRQLRSKRALLSFVISCRATVIHSRSETQLPSPAFDCTWIRDTLEAVGMITICLLYTFMTLPTPRAMVALSKGVMSQCCLKTANFTISEPEPMPKIFSDIKIDDENDRLLVEIKWRGTTWARMEWNSLVSAQDHNEQLKSEPFLLHKYDVASDIQAQQSKPDGGHAMFLDNGTRSVEESVEESVRQGQTRIDNSSFHFDAYDWERLPTLHHMASRSVMLIFLLHTAYVFHMQRFMEYAYRSAAYYIYCMQR